MISLKLQRYAGRKLKAGDEFQASRRDAKLLERMGMAAVSQVIAQVVPVQERQSVPADKPAEPAFDAWRYEASEPAVFPAAEPVAEPEETQEPAAVAAEDAPRPKRKYTRRDMTAE
jgi:hypothetical protein